MIKRGTKHEWAKGMIGLLIVFILFGIYLLFLNKQDKLAGTDSFYPFIILTFIAGAFLLGLFYLVNRTSSKPLKKKKK